MIKRSTQVPNVLFDRYLPHLKESELKILLIVIRQTYGWVDRRTGRRKTRDRITRRQFMQKTGLSRRVVSKAIQSLVEKRLIQVTAERKNLDLLHSCQCGNKEQQIGVDPRPSGASQLGQNCDHNKTIYTKLSMDIDVVSTVYFR